MLNKVVFTDEEAKQIESKLKDRKFCSSSWSDDDLNDLKSKIKKHYLNEQKNTCPYCKQKINSNHGRYWDIEHVISRSSSPGFMFEPVNLCVSCIDCNSAKSDKIVTSSKAKQKYPNTSSSYVIIHPHIDDYDEYILVIKSGFYYVALKPKGEKTIEFCRLNRFYEFSDFGASVQDDDRIFLLSQQLINTQDEKHKIQIRISIAELAIKGSVRQV